MKNIKSTSLMFFIAAGWVERRVAGQILERIKAKPNNISLMTGLRLVTLSDFQL